MHLILFDTTIPFNVVVCFNAIPESPLHEYRKICPRLSPVTPCCPFSPELRGCTQSGKVRKENSDETLFRRRPSLRFPVADRARHIGGKKAGLSFNWRMLSCKNKMRRFQNLKSAAKHRHDARHVGCNRKSLTAAHTLHGEKAVVIQIF